MVVVVLVGDTMERGAGGAGLCALGLELLPSG